MSAFSPRLPIPAVRDPLRRNVGVYVIAVVSTLAATAVHFVLSELLGSTAVFLPFVAAITLAAALGGFRPGVLATALSIVSAIFFFLPPPGSLRVDSARSFADLALFFGIGLMISLLCESLHSSRRRLQSESRRLRESDDFHRIITELTSDYAWTARLESDGTLVAESITEGFTRLLGYTIDELRTLGWLVVIHPDECERALDCTKRAIAGETVQGEMRHVSKDGRLIWLHFLTKPVVDARGNVVGLIGAVQDVTERRAAEATSRRIETEFRHLAEAIPSFLWTAAADGQITYANSEWWAYTGLAPETNARAWPELVVHPEDYDRCVTQWMRAVSEGTPYEIEVRKRRYDGTYRWFVTRAVPLKDDEGKVISWFGVTTDIHNQKEMQDRLRAADKRKDVFLATLAHELRNPLAPIRNAIQYLRMKGRAEPDLQKAREVIDRQVEQMGRLLDDLLDMSRITSEKLDLRTDTADLETILRDAIDTSRPIVESQRHELTVTRPPEPIAIAADADRLTQVFANLLNNAAKYTDPGGRIEVKVELEGGTVLVRVRDSGMGIAQDHLPRIFEMFSQASGAAERSQGGLGIGLSLARGIVELHGGTIEARSPGRGAGSEFIVSLPVLQGARPPEGARRGVPRQTPLRSSLRILVADDNRDSADSLAMMLQAMGNDVRATYDGQEALHIAETYRPDLALLDLGMPQLSGLEFARIVRKELWGREMVLIALTGWGQEDDRRRTEEAGFDRHLVKPVDPIALMELVGSFERHVPARDGA